VIFIVLDAIFLYNPLFLLLKVSKGYPCPFPPPLDGGGRPPMHTPRNIYLSYVIEPVASNQLTLFLNQMNIILNVLI